MGVTTSEVFDFLDQHPTCSIDKYELHSAVFGGLRRGVRKIISRLSEHDEADFQEIANSLRTLLSEWLTVPIPFDGAIFESISAMGDPSTVEMRWGREIREAYDLARAAASAIQQTENPARLQLRDIIRQLRLESKQWRIYCHRRACAHFESILPDELIATDSFLHSVTDYRDAKPFDVLIKMGPLRSKGWGSAPDALLSAPRFGTLFQVVWAGCADEDDFGYDPLIAGASRGSPTSSNSETPDKARPVTSWTRRVIHFGDPASDIDASAESDELRLFRELNRSSQMRRATLLQIDEEDGILYPPHSHVAAFDPNPDCEMPIAYRLPGETLSEGMFMIWRLLGTADLGGVHAGEGHYSRIWKDRLRDNFRYTPNDLLKRLREGGIELNYLRSRVREWCRPASTVIHAPQQMRHFEILIKVLGIKHDPAVSSRGLSRPWWEYAWSEIARARGEAIQTGMQEHEIVDEQLFAILNDLLPEIQSSAQMQAVFQIEIPADKPLEGAVRFYKVRSIEEGFLVPDTILKTICDLNTIEQWRV